MILVSGGQSGVDRAVLDVAIARGIAYGGWCPQGGWAEDYPEPPGLLAKYPQLRQTPLADPAQRTRWNVRDADACMILIAGGGFAISKGTAQAQRLALRYRKPVHVAELCGPDPRQPAKEWLAKQHGTFGADFKLTIGGPRESEVPGIYARAMSFIAALLE
jgi:Circularly permutated YpsA SLOG family